MIELIYNEEEKQREKEEKRSTLEEPVLRKPKNFTQIGSPAEYKKIFMEESVNKFLYRYSLEEKFETSLAVLLGTVEKKAGTSHLYVKGALPVVDLIENHDTYCFSESIWAEVYRQRERYFGDLEICGWCLSSPGLGLEKTDVIEQTHRTFFSGADKLLLMIDSLERESVFWAFDGNAFMKQPGYYLYDAGNRAMERFASEMDRKRFEKEESEKSNLPVEGFRKILQERQIETKKRKMKTRSRGFKSMIAVCLVVGVLFVKDRITGFQWVRAELQKQMKLLAEEKESREVVSESVIVENLEAKITPTAEPTEEVLPIAEQDVSAVPTKQVPTEVPPIPVEQAATEVPAAPAEQKTTEVSATPVYEEYKIQAGDSLAKLCRERYGNLDMLQKICELNGIKDQDHVQIGEIILLP